MPWSIFNPTQGGGPGAAASWADLLLKDASTQWGVNVDTPGNQQFVYDWQKSEGGGGAYNPLNQGPVPGHPELTTTGSQYGGGAADYANLQAGITGAVDYLNMPYYSGIKAGLIANDPAGARAALIASPWAAGHYGYGSGFSSDPVPGQQPILTAYIPGTHVHIPGTGAGGSVLPGFVPTPSSVAGDIGSSLLHVIDTITAPLKSFVENGVLVLFGIVAIIVALVVVAHAAGGMGAPRSSDDEEEGDGEEEAPEAGEAAPEEAPEAGEAAPEAAVAAV